MKNIYKNILGVFAGILLGSSLNMGIIMISGKIIPPPAGANLTTMEGLIAAMPLMEPKHFLLPFLAHALGTLLGAWITALIVPKHKMNYALAIGALYLVGGIMNIIELPSSPLWFTIVDLVFAYIPMGYLAGRFALRKNIPI